MKREKEEIAIASDHAGFNAKEKLRVILQQQYEIMDFTPKKIKGDDYPDYAFKLGKYVAKNKIRGILICGSGVGMTVAANKVNGVRAGEIFDLYTARKSIEDDNTNVAVFGSRNESIEKIKKLLGIWLKTKFSNKARHKRRIGKIKKYEN